MREVVPKSHIQPPMWIALGERDAAKKMVQMRASTTLADMTRAYEVPETLPTVSVEKASMNVCRVIPTKTTVSRAGRLRRVQDWVRGTSRRTLMAESQGTRTQKVCMGRGEVSGKDGAREER